MVERIIISHYIFYGNVFFNLQIIVYNTTLKFQNLQLNLLSDNKFFAIKYAIKILYDKPIIRIYNCQEFKFRNPIKNFTIKNLTINIRLYYNLNKMINGVNII